jgi:NADPH:quinone reductase-like Zn-dependent oxidoreductase
MKAIRYSQYGSPDVLRLEDVEKPVPAKNQVLVKVHAAAANPLDWHGTRGEPALARLSSGLLRPKNPKVGADLAGRVEAVGASVTEFQPGDAVFGVCSGAFAEYAIAGRLKLAHKPAHVSFAAAAASPVVGFTALQGLRDKGQIQAGQKVLINGASGGVGTFAVQLAKSYGTEVTGVCSTRNLELVRSIGADHVIDYTREDFTRGAQRYDLIYDAVGNRSASDLVRVLTPQGICVVAGFGGWLRLFNHMAMGRRLSKPGGQTVGLQGIAGTPHDDLLVIKDLLETGRVVSVIDRTFPLSETAEAIRYLEQGHARGKVVILVASPDERAS